MTATSRSDQKRVERLLRCYPTAWRDRYGDELAMLLLDELAEQPRSWRRTLDVVGSGLIARLSLLGLGAGPVSDARATLGTLAVAAVGFAGCVMSLWSQLALGTGRAPLDAPAAATGLVVLSVTLALAAVVAALAAAPIVVAVVSALRAGRGRAVGAPLLALGASVATLVAGGHLAAGASWVAAGPSVVHLGWALSIGLSAYWTHPHDLAALPRLELGWMALSLLATGTGVTAAIAVVRRVDLSARALRFQARLARLAAAGLAPGLVAAAWWVLSSAGGSPGVYRAGSLDVLMVAAMATALAVASTAATHLRRATRAARG